MKPPRRRPVDRQEILRTRRREAIHEYAAGFAQPYSADPATYNWAYRTAFRWAKAHLGHK